MITRLSIISTILLFSALFADHIAVTEDGRRVRLQSDGTWNFIEDRKMTSQGNNPQQQSNRDLSGTETISSQRSSLIELVAGDSASNFRSVKWYMSKEQVRAAEDASFIGGCDDTLEYELEMFGYLTQLFYIFEEGRLVRVHCNISQPNSNPTRYFRDYEELREYLIPLYGSPAAEQHDWTNDMYKDNRSKWGFAAGIGFLTVRTEWISRNTKIEFVLSGRNHSVTTTLKYSAVQ
ncbi:hypothetical protein CHISP_3065 [Chitinispirillum alkaliphilum]|nr:hypothetical protein CHISP_3065 [Chitinispirillum alkaliphilum]